MSVGVKFASSGLAEGKETLPTRAVDTYIVANCITLTLFVEAHAALDLLVEMVLLFPMGYVKGSLYSFRSRLGHWGSKSPEIEPCEKAIIHSILTNNVNALPMKELTAGL